MAALQTSAANLVRDEVRHHDLAQVPKMDRAGRADPGCAHQRSPATALSLGDHLVRSCGHPIALLHDHVKTLQRMVIQILLG
ncbi:hypothetical protein BG452_00910 [Streptomyces sp. CBMA123]|nr:hypothetical protein [Streptomyces sp. CBMA123]